MSDELVSELRELAAGGEKPPALTGAEIRGRAVRRRRRRRTATAAAGASVAAALALVAAVNLGGADRKPPPAASPTAVPAPTRPAADVTVDLSRHVLSAAGRRLPLSSGTSKKPTPTGRMTVTVKNAVARISGATVGFPDAYDFKVPWYLELTAADGTRSFIAGMTYNDKAPGSYDITSGWIGLRPKDAEWLYRQVPVGAVIDIEDPGRTPSPTPTAADRDTATASSGAGSGASAR
ncbi:L,D-transpeptidase [Streptomyces sp. NPDC002580]|uniref:L,D-transpeptidase n=1 Tax=Streptomyces sp. NPDC002580 TaxID=3364653 RepID=UPI003674310B